MMVWKDYFIGILFVLVLFACIVIVYLADMYGINFDDAPLELSDADWEKIQAMIDTAVKDAMKTNRDGYIEPLGGLR